MCRELTGDIWQLKLKAQLQAFAYILLYSGGFLISQTGVVLGSAQWAYLQTVSLLRAEEGSVLCESKPSGSALMRTGTETAPVSAAPHLSCRMKGWKSSP